MHLPDSLFQQVGKARWFSKIDLRGAFHQVPVKEEDQYKTAFWWNNQLWCYTRVPYGLVNSPATLQRIMDTELSNAGLTDFAVCFVDDLLVYSDTEEEHHEHVRQVLRMLHKVGLRAHPDKSLFCCDAVEYLGFLIGHGHLSPHESKIQAIKQLKSPTNISELRAVLGLCNYYRCFLPDFSVLANGMYTLLQKAVKWNWTEQREAEWQLLKALLCEEGRALRRYDPEAATKVYTDWSNQGIGAVLAQADQEGLEYMVACLSRSLNKHERNYSSYQGELLAAVWGIRSFRHYLHGIEFTLITDHQPLKWLLSTKELTGKHARWMLLLQQYSFEVEHRPGAQHINADVLSRFPLASTYDPTGAQLDISTDDEETEQQLAAAIEELAALTMAANLNPTPNSEPEPEPAALSQTDEPAPLADLPGHTDSEADEPEPEDAFLALFSQLSGTQHTAMWASTSPVPAYDACQCTSYTASRT